MKMIKQMERKYNITIVDDSFYSPLSNKLVKQYKIYTADGCLWENGLSFRGLQAECREFGEAFKRIGKTVDSLFSHL